MPEIIPIKPKVLAVRHIPNVSPNLAQTLKLEPYERSIGLVTATIDDCCYAALDEATKKAEVRVVYARSFYAGSAHASGPLSGEIIGILAGANPAEVRSGLEALVECMENDVAFFSPDGGATAYFAHVISRTGSYLSAEAGIPEGQPLAYLIAPPIEAMVGLDAALKAAEVRLCTLYEPPSPTNFSGCLLTGSQSACKAACQAFASAVVEVAMNPLT